MNFKFFFYILLASFSAFSMWETPHLENLDAIHKISSKKRHHSDSSDDESNKRQKSADEENEKDVSFDNVYVYPFSLFETLFLQESSQKMALAGFDEDDSSTFAALKDLMADANFKSRFKKFEALFSVVKMEGFNNHLFWIEIDEDTSYKVIYIPAGKSKTGEHWINIKEFSTSNASEKCLGDLLTIQFNPRTTYAYFKETGKRNLPKHLEILDTFIKKIIPPLPKTVAAAKTNQKTLAPSKPAKVKPTKPIPKAKAELLPERFDPQGFSLGDLASYVAKFKQPLAVERMEAFWQTLPRMQLPDEHDAYFSNGQILPLQLGKTSGFLRMEKGDYYSQALAEKNFPECAAASEKHNHHYHWKIWEMTETGHKPVLHLRVCEHMGELVKINKGIAVSGNEVAAVLAQLFPLFNVPVYEFDDMHFVTTHFPNKGENAEPAYLNAKIWDIVTGKKGPWYERSLGFSEVIDVKEWQYSNDAHETIRGQYFSQDAKAYFDAVETLKQPITLETLYSWYDKAPSIKTKLKRIAVRALKDQGYKHAIAQQYTLKDFFKAVSERQRSRNGVAEQRRRDEDSFDLSNYLLTGYAELDNKISELERNFRTAIGIVNDTFVFRRPVQDE